MIGRRALTTGALASAALPRATSAQEPWKPTKPIRLIVPFAAGSGSDILARILAEPLTQSLGQPIVVENKPGNNTTLGTELVVQSAPDGYTLGLLTNSGLAASPGGLTSGVRYHPTKDLTYATMVASVNYILLVNNDVAAKTAGELVALVKANPGKFNYASGNTGGIAYGGHFKSGHQLEMTHVPYRGTNEAVADIITGRLAVLFGPHASVSAFGKDGRLRMLAVTSAKRMTVAPELPTIAESGVPGYAADVWYGVLAPAKTSKAIVTKLHGEIFRLIAVPDTKEKLLSQGFEPVGSTSEAFAAQIRAEIPKWGKVIKDAGIKAE